MDIIVLNKILYFISKIATISMALPIIIALKRRNYWNKSLMIFFRFCFFRIIIAILIQIIYWEVSQKKSILIQFFKYFDLTSMNFMAILTSVNYFVMLGCYFSNTILNKEFSIYIKYISIVLSIIAIVNFFFGEGYKEHNVFNSAASNIFCFILPLIHLWFLYIQDSKVPISKNPYCWINIGLILPNLLGLITSLFGKKLEETDLTLYLQIDIAYSILQIIGYLLIAIGFYYARYTKYMPKATTE